MTQYTLTTDNNADLPEAYIAEHNLKVLSLSYTIDGETYSRNNELPVKEFYEKMRTGSLPTTAQVNPELAKEIFLPILKGGEDILHIAFSSGLSGSYNSCVVAANELLEEFPDRKIVIVDSLCASLGEGLLVHQAVTRKEKGATLEDVASWCETHKGNIIHNFTVDDLNHLYRGGRVSKTAAFIGTIVNIKPLLHVDSNGHLVPIGKVRGRKKSLQALVESMEKQIGSYRKKNDVVFISHGDCEADAFYVADLIKSKFQIETFLIHYVGPTIGAHSGPGTVALFYLGDIR